jgi:type II secretory pathway component PulF
MGENLPLPTQILISTSNGIRQWWFWIILVLVIVTVFIKREAKTKIGKISLSILQLRIPIYGSFILKAELSRFCRTLGLLIKSGLPVLSAIDVSVPVISNEVIKNQVQMSYKELEQGGSFGRSLKQSKSIPLFMSNLIVVGEESGKLDEALEEIANSYEHDTDEAMKAFTSLLEPVIILAMGLIVGFIVIAMLLPIFEINMTAV